MCTFLSWTESFVDYSCPRRSDIKKLVAVDSCSQGVRCHDNFLYNCRPPLAELAHTSGKCMTLSDCRFCHKRSVPHCRITRCIVVSVMACEEHCTSEEASILGSWNSCGVVVQDMQWEISLFSKRIKVAKHVMTLRFQRSLQYYKDMI